MIPAFPQELIDQIIDYLWDDPQSLQSCSLCCRSWLPASGIHLFGDKNLFGCQDFLRFEQLLQKLPDIASCVRTLSICADHWTPMPPPNRGTPRMNDWTFRIPLMLEKLHRLRDLSLSNLTWCWVQLDVDGVGVLARTFAGLERLSMKNVHLMTFSEFQPVVAAARKLVALRLIGVVCPSLPDFFPASDASSHPDLEDLCLDGPASLIAAAQWLLSSNRELHLRKLDLSSERDEVQAMGNLLRASGAHLEQLSLCPICHIEEDGDGPTLAYNTNLRILVLKSVYTWSLSLTATIRLLSTIRSTQLQMIDVKFCYGQLQDFSWINWSGLDWVLSGARFSGVHVTFDIQRGGSVAIQSIRQLIINALPKLQERGALVIESQEVN
ncbi:hypothetical protein AcW1_007989 [Taiwanofungus camphoratus]|nr:hypothetical protein AcV5_008282 [Antrodia cinnamomea]KAI0950768.1 hypothetical protein AcW1_007989 [Antrodia cinnamomea]KAI0955677.1 hypothetical protein AcV7_006277 [Antrodia cinnamomea]